MTEERSKSLSDGCETSTKGIAVQHIRRRSAMIPAELSRSVTPGGVDYLTGGSSDRGVVVFTHGYRDSAIGWQWVCSEMLDSGWRFASVQRAVAPSASRIGESLETYASQVNEVLDRVASRTDSVVLVGQSMGGAVAELAARSRPNLDALVLVNPAPLGGTALPGPVQESFEESARVRDSKAVALGKLNLCVLADDEVKARLVAATPTESEESSLQTLHAWIDGHPYGSVPSIVGVPTLIVTTDDQFFTDEMLRSAVAPRFRDATVSSVRGAGHFPHLERPLELAQAIVAFLDERLPASTDRRKGRPDA